MQEEVETKNNKNAVLRQVLLTTYLDIKRSGRNVWQTLYSISINTSTEVILKILYSIFFYTGRRYIP